MTANSATGLRALAGKAVLVTGANRGIGHSFVDALLDAGVGTVFAGVRDPGDAPVEWRDDGRIVPLRLDVTSRADIDAAARQCGAIDLFISNAGMTCLGPVLDCDEDTARQVMEVNYFGPMALTRALAPGLIERKGGIIYVLSMAAMVPPGPAPVYSATKSAAAMLAAGIRNELGEKGCDVTLCFPGYVDTRMSEFYPHRKTSPEEMAAATLRAWRAGTGHVFPDPFSELVLDYMRQDGARFLVEAPRVREEIAEVYLAGSPKSAG